MNVHPAIELIRRLDINRELIRAGKPLTVTDYNSTADAMAAYRRNRNRVPAQRTPERQRVNTR